MELPRGMKDFVGSETANIEHIRSHFKQLSNLYGFSFMDPSPIELLSTLETKSGPAIKDEIYYFKDKGKPQYLNLSTGVKVKLKDWDEDWDKQKKINPIKRGDKDYNEKNSEISQFKENID